MAGARLLHRALGEASMAPFRLVRLPPPDINIVCFLLVHPKARSLAELNALNEEIYARMSLSTPGSAPDYIITRTRFQTPMYDGAVDPVLDAVGVGSIEEWKKGGQEGLVVLRSTVMDPFLAEDGPGADHVRGFIGALERAARAAAGRVFAR